MDYTASCGSKCDEYTSLCGFEEWTIRHHAVRGVMSIRHYADLQDGLYGIMRFEV